MEYTYEDGDLYLNKSGYLQEYKADEETIDDYGCPQWVEVIMDNDCIGCTTVNGYKIYLFTDDGWYAIKGNEIVNLKNQEEI